MAGRKRARWIVVSSAAVAAALGVGRRAAAGNFYWEGDSGSAWNANGGAFGTNWSSQLNLNNDPLALPGSGDDVFFTAPGAPSGPVNTTLGQNFAIRSLTLLGGNTDPVTIDGGGGANTLTIGAGGFTSFSAQTGNAINAGVVLGADQTWTNNAAGTSVLLGGIVSGSGTLTTAGAGSFTFTSANTWTGGLVVGTAGNAVSLTGLNGSARNLSSLQLNGGAVLNLDSSGGNQLNQNRLADTLTVASGGGTLNLAGNNSVATTETVGTLQVNSGGTQVNVTGAAGSGLVFGSAAIPSVSRAAGGTVNFTPADGTFVRLANATVTNGILGAHATVGTIKGSSLDAAVDWATLDGSKNVVPFTGYVSTMNAGDNTKLTDPTTLGTGTTTVNSLYLTLNAGITFTGGTNSADVLVVNSGGIIVNNAFPTAPVNGNTANSNTLIIGNDQADTTPAGGPKTSAGFITSGSGELIVTAANGNGLRIASVITDNGTNSVGLTLTGNGILDLGGGNSQNAKIVNTYSGLTTVNGGTLIVNADTQFGSTTTPFRANAITLNGGTILTTAGFTFATNRGIFVGAEGGTLRYTGGSTWTLSAAISGPGGVTFSALPTSTAGGADFVVINQAAGKNSYAGPTTFEVGKNPFTANFGTVRLGQNDEIPHNSALTMNQFDGSGNIDFNGKSLTVGSLAGNAPVVNHNSVLTIGQNGLSTTYSGTIAGSGSVVKVGSGAQTFSGNSTYSGATTINGGTLLITGVPTGTGLVTVNNGGALGGNGVVAAPVTVNAGGALAPAVDPITPSNLTINNNLTLANGAVLNFLMGAPGNNDVVTVSGAGKSLALTGGAGSDILNINDIAGFGIGTYTLLQAANGATLNDNATFVINGNTQFNYATSFTNGDGGSLILTVTAGNDVTHWTGAVNNAWDTSTGNWNGPQGNRWADLDNAVFDNAGQHTDIAVTAAGVQPNSMLFNNGAVNYSFSGGPITSTGSLTKNQAGALTFNDTVSVGVATINGGSLTIGSTGSFTSPLLTIAPGATLNVNGALGASTNLQSDGVTNINRAAQTLGGLSGGANGVVNLAAGGALTVGAGTFNGTITGAGASVTVSSPGGGGMLTLGGANAYTGPTTVLNGTLVANGNVAPGVAGPLGNSTTPVTVGDASGAGSATLLMGGPSTFTRDILVRGGNTGTPGVGGSSADVSTFADTITLANTNAATLLLAGGGGTVNYTGSLTGPGAVNAAGPGTSVFVGNAAAYTGPTTVSGGALNVPGSLTSSPSIFVTGGTLNASGTVSVSTSFVQTGGTVNLDGGLATPTLSVGPGTFNLNAAGRLAVAAPNGVTVAPGGTFNASGTSMAVAAFNVGAPGTVNAQLTFASGVGYTNAVNVLGPGFVTLSGTSTATSNLVSGPIALSGGGGVILMVAQQTTTASPINLFNGRINVTGGTGSNGADAIFQVRNTGTSTVPAVGVFTNVHVADKSGLNIGLVPSAANPRDQIVVDLSLDGTSAFLSSNSDGSSPEFVRTISAANPGTLLTVFALNGTNVANVNNPNFAGLGAKSINFVGSLSPGLTVLNTEAPGAGINLTSNTNVASAFSLNGGTFQTGSLNGANGTTNLQADATPGTNGTFLVTAGTFNVNRSADATLTYTGGTLTVNADQTLTAFNLGNGTDPISYDLPGFAITAGKLNVAAQAALNANASTLTAGPTTIDGTLTLGGGTVTTGAIGGAGQVNMTVDAPGLVAGDDSSATFTGTIVGTGSLTKQGTGTQTLAGASTYTGPTTVNAGELAVTGSIATSSGVTVNGGGTFRAAAGQSVKTLAVTAGGVAKVAAPAGGGGGAAAKFALTIGDGTAATNPLTIDGGKVDVTTNGLVVRVAAGGAAAALRGVRDQIVAGYHATGAGNNGNWAGNGITSANAAADTGKAVGYALASELATPADGKFLGQPVDASSVVVRYTAAGDATMDGTVDFNDLVKLAQNYNTKVSSTTDSWWTHGDFTYDGVTDFNDLVKLAQNYNTVLPSEAIPGAPANFATDLARAVASVPEPGGLALLGGISLAALTRRRRRSHHTNGKANRATVE